MAGTDWLDISVQGLDRPQIAASIVAVGPGAGAAASSVVLTYDDGPEPGGTEAVLTALADLHVTATFFVLLSRVRRYPRLLGDIMAAGHEVALHGPDHRRLTELDPAAVGPHIAGAKRRLEDVTGRPVRWLRPPYGSQSAATWRDVTAVGLTPVMWDAHCSDWYDMPGDARLEQVRALDGPGAIVCLHDGFASHLDSVNDGPPPHIDRGHLTRSVIATCTSKGLTCCSLEEALRTGRPVLRVWLDSTSDAASDGEIAT